MYSDLVLDDFVEMLAHFREDFVNGALSMDLKN